MRLSTREAVVQFPVVKASSHRRTRARAGRRSEQERISLRRSPGPFYRTRAAKSATLHVLLVVLFFVVPTIILLVRKAHRLRERANRAISGANGAGETERSVTAGTKGACGATVGESGWSAPPRRSDLFVNFDLPPSGGRRDDVESLPSTDAPAPTNVVCLISYFCVHFRFFCLPFLFLFFKAISHLIMFFLLFCVEKGGKTRAETTTQFLHFFL